MISNQSFKYKQKAVIITSLLQWGPTNLILEEAVMSTVADIRNKSQLWVLGA